MKEWKNECALFNTLRWTWNRFRVFLVHVSRRCKSEIDTESYMFFFANKSNVFFPSHSLNAPKVINAMWDDPMAKNNRLYWQINIRILFYMNHFRFCTHLMSGLWNNFQLFFVFSLPKIWKKSSKCVAFKSSSSNCHALYMAPVLNEDRYRFFEFRWILFFFVVSFRFINIATGFHKHL